MESRSFRAQLIYNSSGYSPTRANAAEIVRISNFLEHGELTSCNALYRGTNHVFLISLVKERETIKAIYKPRQGERPLWDFPDGTLYTREYAAFLVSQALGWELVPPTVIRSGPYGIGSMQWFVEAKPGADYHSLREKCLSVLKRVAVFDYLSNNADRKAGHFLEGQDGRLWLIDHGLTFNAEPKLRTVIWDFAGEPVPQELITDVIALQEELVQTKPLRKRLSRLLATEEIEALEHRISRLIDNPVFPQPESYRSVPWPWY